MAKRLMLCISLTVQLFAQGMDDPHENELRPFFFIENLSPVCCLAFAHNENIIIGTSTNTLLVKINPKGEHIPHVLDGEYPPLDFIISRDRTRLGIKNEKCFVVYDLPSKKRLQLRTMRCSYYSADFGINNIPFVSCQTDLFNMKKSLDIPFFSAKNNLQIACHPREKIISYPETMSIINIDYNGNTLFSYHPDLTSNPCHFYQDRDLISSAFYNDNGNYLACITTNNRLVVYNIINKTTERQTKSCTIQFFGNSILAFLDLYGSIFFLDYIKEESNQLIAQTKPFLKYPLYPQISKKIFDFSPNDYLCALLIENKCLVQSVPFPALLKKNKHAYKLQYLFLRKIWNEKVGFPIELIKIIMMKRLLITLLPYFTMTKSLFPSRKI
jgi:WD40 repeat protein